MMPAKSKSFGSMAEEFEADYSAYSARFPVAPSKPPVRRWPGGIYGSHLIERFNPGVARGAVGGAKSPNHLDISRLPLALRWRRRRASPWPRQWRPRGRACRGCAGAGGSGNSLEHLDALGLQVHGQPSAIGAGGLHAHSLDIAETPQPPQGGSVSGRGSGKRLHTQFRPVFAERGHDVQVAVGADSPP